MGFVTGPVKKVFEETDYQKWSVCVNKISEVEICWWYVVRAPVFAWKRHCH